MDSNTVPADVRWAIANWPESAERGEVSRFCQRQGISRSVFYKIRRQAREQGLVDATEPGSRRPLKSPRRVDPKVIEQALGVRAWLVEQGLDARPLSVREDAASGSQPAVASHARQSIRRGRGFPARAT